eukprot:Rhum_TRINITY_DN10661_c0_g1::Rhum_TRINITY_DN10661_c0_g1_i1::g.39231::m.39231
MGVHGKCVLYSDVPSGWALGEFEEIFSHFGKISTLSRPQSGNDREIAVTYKDKAAAYKSVSEFNGAIIGGEMCRARIVRDPAAEDDVDDAAPAPATDAVDPPAATAVPRPAAVVTRDGRIESAPRRAGRGRGGGGGGGGAGAGPVVPAHVQTRATPYSKPAPKPAAQLYAPPRRTPQAEAAAAPAATRRSQQQQQQQQQ